MGGGGIRPNLPCIKPATEEKLGEAALGGPSDVDKAVRAAAEAFPAWSRLAQSERAKLIYPMAAAIREAAEELIALEVREHGTPIQVARGFIVGASDQVEFTVSISRALTGQVLNALPNATCYLQRVPLGVCAVITPWNVPLLMMSAMVTPLW
jgi:acyl-CoA reductase-like NAD-dependent aldehyde dehydrogenase